MKLSISKNARASKKYLKAITKVMKKNDTFIYTSASETGFVIIELINDAIDYVFAIIKNKSNIEEYPKYSMYHFIQHILMPFSYAIYTDMLISNIPACFMELRLILESMTKSYMADYMYKNFDNFQDKLLGLEKYLFKNHKSISWLMKTFDEKMENQSEFFKLWKGLSEDWVHPKGILK